MKVMRDEWLSLTLTLSLEGKAVCGHKEKQMLNENVYARNRIIFTIFARSRSTLVNINHL